MGLLPLAVAEKAVPRGQRVVGEQRQCVGRQVIPLLSFFRAFLQFSSQAFIEGILDMNE